MVLFDAFLCCFCLFSEGENLGIEEPEFFHNSANQGKPG
jgi:hypothetical protein